MNVNRNNGSLCSNTWLEYCLLLGMKTLILSSLLLLNTPTSASVFDVFKMRGSLNEKVKDLKKVLKKDFSLESCEKDLEIPIKRFSHEHLDKKDFEYLSENPAIIKEIWDTRQELLNKFKGFDHDQKDLASDCLNKVRELNYEMRSLEDYLGATLYHQRDGKLKGLKATFEGTYPNLLSSEKFFEYNKSLRDGDIFVTKGNFFFSGALAKIGIYDTHFSHQGIVHKIDDQFYTAEAHPEVGATVRKLEEMNNNDKNVRTLVVRFPQEEISREAGKHGYDVVKNAMDSGVNVPYDFTMNYNEKDFLFCSELVTYAFELATDNEIQFPMYRTEFELKKSNFAKKLGITSADALHPGDIEFDPRVVTVAEWRDFSRVMDNIVKDEILHMLYYWMENDNYQLFNTAEATIHENVTFNIRPWPLFNYLLHEKFPVHIPKEYIGTVLTLQRVGDVLYSELTKENEKKFKDDGRYLKKSEMHKFLQKVLDEDKKIWKKWQKVKNNPKSYRESFRKIAPLPRFHLIFHD